MISLISLTLQIAYTHQKRLSYNVHTGKNDIVLVCDQNEQ